MLIIMTTVTSPPLPLIPTTYMQCEQGLEEWEERVPEILSSPSAQRFTYWVKGTKTNLARAEIQNLELVQLHQMLEGQNKKKLRSRKSIQTGGALTASQAHEKIRIKRQKEQAEAERKANRAITLAVRAAEKAHHRRGVDARRAERERKAKVKELQAKGQ